jgi:hypothetical protein
MQKMIHYARNQMDVGPKIPDRLIDIDYNEWIEVGKTGTHNLNGDKGNRDFRGKKGTSREGQQAIYDKDGKLVLSDENKGSLDFVTPLDNWANHMKLDVAPWIKWGNSPNDRTTREEREAALGSINMLGKLNGWW